MSPSADHPRLPFEEADQLLDELEEAEAKEECREEYAKLGIRVSGDHFRRLPNEGIAQYRHRLALWLQSRLKA